MRGPQDEQPNGTRFILDARLLRTLEAKRTVHKTMEQSGGMMNKEANR